MNDVISSTSTEIDTDIEEARQTYRELIEIGKRGLNSSFDLLEASQHPRAAEVFSGLLSSLASVNEKLVNLQDTKMKMKKPSSSDEVNGFGQIQNTQNNIYIGSSSELLRLISNHKEDQDADI